MPSPFDFSHANLIDIYLWTKLLFDQQRLANNPYFTSDPDPDSSLLNPKPMAPTGGAAILPPDFR
jgi:hypothetical protein